MWMCAAVAAGFEREASSPRKLRERSDHVSRGNVSPVAISGFSPLPGLERHTQHARVLARLAL
jgi:hypothetical protein